MRERLTNVIGFSPCDSWLDECLRATSNNEEQVLEQILHHDIRAVVDPRSMSAAARQLRQAVNESTQKKTELSESFRLLVQVEAFADMTQGREKRLEQSNPRSRCLKLAYTDGYENTIFTAAEISPLIDLQLLAGVKVLLKGPLIIRNGIMGWSPSNAIVLGGEVAELVLLQQQAMQRAKQRAGHGVDPTIKALIWNNQNLEEQEDESERASEDLTAAAARTAQPVPPAQPVPTPVVQRTQEPLQLGPNQQATGPPHRTQEPFQQGPNQQAARAPEPVHPNRSPLRLEAQPSRVSTISPVARSSPSTSINPYARPAAGGISPVNQPSANSHALSSQSSTASATGHMVTAIPVQQIAPVPATTVHFSFEQLHHSLKRALTDNEMLLHLSSKVMTTQLAQVGNHIHFNIERSKVGGSKSYKYIMDAKFNCPSAKDSLITCRVSSEILEPLFSMPAGDMRKLSKQDKERAAQLVRDGGNAVQREMKKLRSYQVSLLLNEQARPGALDGETPILLLLKLGNS